jgi:regulator of sirC expression with transglutaminase-like and TPR domain
MDFPKNLQYMSEDFLTARQRTRRAFASLIAGDDASIDLAQAALLIAAEEYPELDMNQYLERLQNLAEQVRLRVEKGEKQVNLLPTTVQECMEVLYALNAILFEQEHFRGNRANYYDPENSFLNRVLERRLGIPLTLSLLYMEVGKRLGLCIEGIGMPFRFIVRCTIQESAIYVDPYEKGRFLSEEDCRERLTQIFKNEEDLDPHWLEPLSHKQLLVRMLINLKHVYIRNRDFQRALNACDRILLVNPNLPTERRDRGIVHFQLKYYARALHDLNAYLELSPQADDLEEVRQQIKLIRHIIAMMN